METAQNVTENEININDNHNNRCYYSSFGCNFYSDNSDSLDQHYNNINSVNHHLQLISEKILSLFNQIQLQRESSFRLEKLFSNFPKNIQPFSKKKVKKLKLIKPHNTKAKKKNLFIYESPGLDKMTLEKIEQTRKEINNTSLMIDLSQEIPKKKMPQFKMGFYDYILNDKDISWKVKLHKIENNIALGICSLNKDNSNPIYHEDYEEIFQKRSYLLENGQIILNCNNTNENNFYDVSLPEYYQGEIVNFKYSSKDNTLKIFNEKFDVTLTNISYFENDSKLIPCFVIKNENLNQIEFYDFQYNISSTISLYEHPEDDPIVIE